jgi:F-type H+-transporting ATPase subunit a
LIPGSFIFDHIGDAYDWHLFDINGRHYSVPLPVILYSREKGLNIFYQTGLITGMMPTKASGLNQKDPGRAR